MISNRLLPPRPVALAEKLLREIGSGKYPVGSRFPSDQDLQIRFDVGRHTVREALKILAEQGVIGRRQKTGSVVLAERPVPHYVHSLRDLRGLFDFARSTHLAIGHFGYVSKLQDASLGTTISSPSRWLRVAGLRSTRNTGEPLCWSEVLVAAHYVPTRDTIEAGKTAIYEQVMQRHGLKLDYVEQDISAGPLPQSLARLLRAEGQVAALVVRRRYVATNGSIFEISFNLYPADRYSVSSILRQRA